MGTSTGTSLATRRPQANADRYRVKATALNLRSQPALNPKNRIALLPHGHELRKVAEAGGEWWQIETVLGGKTVGGFIARGFVEPATQVAAPAAGSDLAVHWGEGNPKVIPQSRIGHASPIGDSAAPRRSAGTQADRVAQLLNVIGYLGVEKSPRYAKQGATTYCNIYAYDYCYLAGVYLPRVWWTEKALQALARGERVAAKYGATLLERTANELFDWLVNFGPEFGWSRTTSLNELQEEANQGGVGIICAQRVDLASPGHIVTVVPEHAEFAAVRRSGVVQRPLQSQAGAANQQFFTGNKNWWSAAKFRQAAFWHHA